MKKSEAETAIKHLAIEWAKETEYVYEPCNYPSFASFSQWLSENHYESYLNFKSTTPSSYAVECWFETAIKNHFR